jgi:hypothetical protein
MLSTDDVIDRIVGKAFEMDCPDIEVFGIRDSASPLYKGPGVIVGEQRGPISFRLHNQIKMSPEALDSMRPIEHGTLGAPVSQVRVFAKDYSGTSWTGGWAIPNIEYARTAQFMVSGNFSQLSTDIPKSENDPKTDLTEIVFADKLNLPMTEVVEEKRLRGDEIIFSKAWTDRHELDFNGARVVFFENSTSDRTHITAEHKGGLEAPYCEVWLAEALGFIRARLAYARIAIRHLEKDSLVFIRTTPGDTRSEMPRPIVGPPSVSLLLWNLYSAYLGECVKHKTFGSMELTQVLDEVIIASTGTVQAFVLSLAICVENLVKKLAKEISVDVPDADTINRLIEHMDQWPGDTNVKERTKKMLPSLRNVPAQASLRILRDQGVIDDNHIKAWSKIRNKLAHGGMVEYPLSPDLWEQRNTLIAMVYRLMLRIIGYRGPVTDHASGNLIQFDWR